VGAAFMVAFHVMTPEDAYRFVDMGTLVLLFGMMVIVGHLKLAGFLPLGGRFRGTTGGHAACAPRRRRPRVGTPFRALRQRPCPRA